MSAPAASRRLWVRHVTPSAAEITTMGEAVQAFTAGPDIDVQPASEDIWDKKYRLKDRAGNPVDADILDTYKRVARALAEARPKP